MINKIINQAGARLRTDEKRPRAKDVILKGKCSDVRCVLSSFIKTAKCRAGILTRVLDGSRVIGCLV